MISHSIKAVFVASALVAIPGMAIAGTSTATGTASFNVASQCSVTGASVTLGTFTTTQTWADVGAELGTQGGPGGTVFTAGTKGFTPFNYGSVTCDAGTPYSLTIRGTGPTNTMRMSVNGKVAFLPIFIKRIGVTNMPDTNAVAVGAGTQNNAAIAGTGTGTAQALLGSALIAYSVGGTTAAPADPLGAAGSFTDTLTYTLNF